MIVMDGDPAITHSSRAALDPDPSLGGYSTVITNQACGRLMSRKQSRDEIQQRHESPTSLQWTLHDRRGYQHFRGTLLECRTETTTVPTAC